MITFLRGGTNGIMELGLVSESQLIARAKPAKLEQNWLNVSVYPSLWWSFQGLQKMPILSPSTFFAIKMSFLKIKW